MTEVQLKCPSCKSQWRVEREQRSAVKPVCGHGTILDWFTKEPNLLQCVCGKYLDKQHVFTEAA